MSLNLALELWEQTGELVPAIFTSNRFAASLTPDRVLAEVAISGVEASAVLLKQAGFLGGVTVYPSMNAHRKLDVTARETEAEPDGIFDLASSALARAIGLTQRFDLTALNPYLRIDTALSPGDESQVYRCGTIVFPHAAVPIGAPPDLKAFKYKDLLGSSNYGKVAPTFAYEVSTAVAALGLKV